MKDLNEYLSINQVAKACSISRASILRMEQDGILTPAYINPENGYRYYDTNNVLRITRNISLQELGITHKELKMYYSSEDNYCMLLSKLQEKLATMEYHIAGLKLMLKQEEHLSTSQYYFPELYCYTYLMRNVTDLTSVRPAIWTTLQEAIKKGYSIDRQMRPFVVVNFSEMVKNGYQNVGYDYKICIPVINKGINDNELTHYNATNSLSVILYGGAQDIVCAFDKIKSTIQETKAEACEFARIIAAVNSYPGENVPYDYWTLRICLPIIKN